MLLHSWLMAVWQVTHMPPYAPALLSAYPMFTFPATQPCNPPQSVKVDKESGQALSCVNCYFMCQVRLL